MQARKEQTLKRIFNCRVSAILRTHDRRLAADAMSAAVAGGFRMVEFTLTTPGALELISEFAENPELLVGAGTVLSKEDATQAVSAGARFIVSPVCDPRVIASARDLGVVSIPGTLTPTEMFTAHRHGADLVKLFPSCGDVSEYVASILGPLPFLRIFPTAGVSLENFVTILRAGAAGVGFVRPLFTPEDMSAGNFAAIERRAIKIMRLLQEHTGITVV